MPLTSAALVGCGVVTGMGAVFNRANVELGQTAAVFGVGGVGLNVIQALKVQGCPPDRRRRHRHRQGSARQAVRGDPLPRRVAPRHRRRDRRDQPVQRRQRRAGRSTRAASTGRSTVSPSRRSPTTRSRRSTGRARSSSSVCPARPPSSTGSTAGSRRSTAGSSAAGTARSHPERDIPLIIDLYRRGEILLDELVSVTYPMAEFEQAVHAMESGSIAAGRPDVHVTATRGGRPRRVARGPCPGTSTRRGRASGSSIEERAARRPTRRWRSTSRTARSPTASSSDWAERVAAGLAARGIGEGTNVSWILPSRIEAFVLAGALARLGAVQNPILPIYRAARGRVHRPPDRMPSCSSCPAPSATSTTRRWRARRTDEPRRRGPRRRSRPPRGRPGDARPAREQRRQPGALALLHVGHRSPTRRARSTPTPAVGREPRHAVVDAGRVRRQRRRGVPDHARRRPACGCSTRWRPARELLLVEIFSADAPRPFLAAARTSRARAPAPCSGSRTSTRSASSPTCRCSRTCGSSTAAARPSRRPSHYELMAEMGAPVIGGLGAHRVADQHDDARSTAPTTKKAATDGRPCPGVELRVGDRRRARRSARARRASSRSKGPQVCLGYLDSSARRRRVRRATAGSAPAISASSTTRAT